MTSGESPMTAPVELPAFHPLYKQIKKLLVQRLEGHAWKPGQIIPTELELSRLFAVSQGTIRRALDELVAENILIRRQGKGTFVATHTEPTHLYRFLRLMPFDGAQEQPERKLVKFQRARASEAVAKALELKTADPILLLRRLLVFRGVPTVLEDISLPARMFKGLTAAKFEERNGYIYELLESEYGVKMVRADEKVTAFAATAELAKSLVVPVDTPLLCVERIAFTYRNRPVEFRRGFYRTDRHYYMSELG
jgi:GntR family transcriptional regulator